ncbi:MAG: hypothetical protein CVT88_01170 [Candidatus Altiarchaeales archaeon HGW-Altiarchaeales-1]|nr:MAG: hypothetical protein CVT88_01170 [Candidatus Altiarchaeales archaeon HGW-Altiarchaeales-1]
MCGLWEMVVEEDLEKHGSEEMVLAEAHQKSLKKTKKKSKRIILLSPPFRKIEYERYRLGENLGIRYLASFLENIGYEVEVLDPSLSHFSIEKTAKIILKEDYDLIGFTIPNGGLFSNVVKVIRILRKNGFKGHITLGGHFPTFEHKEILRYNKNIDSIVQHEGEITLFELVNNLDKEENFKNILGLSYRNSKQICINPPRPLIKNLNDLPFPKRDKNLKYNQNNHYTMVTSRGCYGNCSFCSIRAFYDYDKPLWRYRSPNNVVDEIKYLINNYNAKVISFMDDNFIGPGKFGKKRAIEIANEIINRGISIYFEISCRPNDIDEHILKVLKRAGLRHVSVGIESGNEDVLKRFNKKTTVLQNINAIKTLRKTNLSFTPYFIMFDPWTTISELKDNLRFLYNNNICTYRSIKNAITLYNGTPFYEQLKHNSGRVNWEYQYNFKNTDVAEVYFMIDSLSEFNKINPIIDILMYTQDLNNKGIRETLKKIQTETNEFTYNTTMRIINWVTNDKSENDHFAKDIRDDISSFTDQIKNLLFAKGLEQVLHELEFRNHDRK